MTKIPFQTIDWTSVEIEEIKGESGTATSQTMEYDGLGLRLVEFAKGYQADHWCKKGHIVHCMEGEFDTELERGETVKLIKGMTFIVSDNLSSHRSFSATGVKLLIIDGDFLK